MARITISNRGGSDGRNAAVEASPAVSVLNALLVEGVRIRHDCGGKALCGTCAIRLIKGERGLSPLGPLESQRLAAGGRLPAGGPTGFRLACQARTARDIEIEIVLE